jgi:RES domain-containing protein
MSDLVQAWRLVKANRAPTAFEGEGAYRFGGRWNSRGVRAVYASSTLALALLEILVHIDPAGRVPELMAIPIRLPASMIERDPCNCVSQLADGFGWPIGDTRRTGDAWIRAARKPALQLPSAVVPIEHNYLLNPQHPDFHQLKIGPAEPFSLDPRLIIACTKS